MSEPDTSHPDPARQARNAATRVARVWRHLPHERKLAAGAAIGLFVTLFLPWYQDTVIVSAASKADPLKLASASLTGWGAFSFVEAAVLLVAVSVLVLLFVRGEGRAFHVPGGDGGVIMAAGFWTCVLVLWRIFDKEAGHSNHGLYLTSTGIEWGIFIALAVAGFLAYAGSRIRIAHEPEPPLPGERGAPPRETPAPTRRVPTAADPAPTRRVPTAADQVPTRRVPTAADQAPTRRVSPEDEQTQRMRSDEGRRASRGLGLPEVDEIELEDPPTVRLGRAKPASPRTPESAEGDQLQLPPGWSTNEK